MTLLSPGAVGRRLNLSTSRVWLRPRVIQLDREGVLRAIRDSAGRRFYDFASVESFAKSREQRRAARGSRRKTRHVEAVKRSYRKDRWTDQPEWIECWSEKGTVRGTLAPVLNAYGITLRVLHGYGSATAVYQAAQDSVGDEDKLLTVLYVGDHDPSGLHMSEVDLPRRLKQYGGVVDLIRLALTKEDTRSGLPSFATDTKRQDARFRWYLERYGSRCWELDALSPVVLRDRVEEAIVAHLDREAWERAAATERAECESLATILNAWPGLARSNISGQASE